MEKWHTNKEIPNDKDRYIIKWKGHNTYGLATGKEWVESRLKNPSGFTEIERWAYIKDFEATFEQHQQKQIDWEQRRYEIAKAAMVGQLASPIVEGIDPNPSMPDVCKWSVMFADALIKELKQTRIDDLKQSNNEPSQTQG